MMTSGNSKLFIKALPLTEQNDNDKGAVFFGTGLVTSKAVSEGLPFDFLSLVAAAEIIRRQKPGLERIVHYIADETALQNGFAQPEDIKRRADQVEGAARGIAEIFGIASSYTILRGSALRSDQARRKLMEKTRDYAAGANLPPGAEGYVMEQLADMALLRGQYAGRVKLSWTMARNENALGKGFDESFFDRHYQACFSGDPDAAIDFAYIQPGRRLDPKANRACPYTAVAGEPRLSLREGFNRAALLEQSGLTSANETYREAVRYWGMITDTLEFVFDLKGIPKSHDEDRIDALQRRLAAAALT